MTNRIQEMQSHEETRDTSAAQVDLKFEIVVIPVSDVDRARDFYTKLEWRFDIDTRSGNDYAWFSSRQLAPLAPSSSARTSPRLPDRCETNSIGVNQIEAQ
jgi:catechol 2,3-dioxygenase-like lactoylglutathione lyase family enzyme